MDSITFLKTASQLERVERERPHLLGGRVVALSPEVWLRLRQSGRSVVAASELLIDVELRTIARQARSIAAGWFARLGDALTYRGVNLGELVRLDNTIFFRELLAAHAIGRRILTEQRPAGVTLFADGTVACVGSHRHTGRHDVCEGVLLHLFRTAGVPVTNLAPEARERWPFVPVEMKRRLLRLARRASTPSNDGLASTAQRAESPAGDWVAAIGEEVDLAALSALADVLRAGGSGLRVKLISTDDQLPDFGDRSGVRAVDPDAVGFLRSMVTPPDDAGRFLSRLARIRKRVSELSEDALGVPASLAGAVGVRAQFDWMWKRAWPDAVHHIAAVDWLYERARPQAVIVAGVERYRDRATVKRAKVAGIPTVAIPHGHIEDIDCFDFETDTFLAWGEASRRSLMAEFDKPADAIDVIGPIHLASLASARPRVAERRDRRALLAITSRLSPVCFDETDAEAFHATWTAVLDFFATRDDVELVIKPCPGGFDQAEWYRRLAAAAPRGNVRVVEGVRVEDIAGGFDGALIMFDVTTAQFVTHLCGLPTVLVRCGWRVTPERVRRSGLPDGFESIDAPDAVAATLARLLDDPAYRRACVERGERQLRADADVETAADISHVTRVFQRALRMPAQVA